MTKGFWTALADLAPTYSYVVAPVETGWAVRTGVEVVSLGELLAKVGKLTCHIPLAVLHFVFQGAGHGNNSIAG